MDVNGMAAVVTGAASGLGEATARELARRGANVAVFDRDIARGEQVARDLGGIFCEVDVTSDDEGRGGVRESASGARPGTHSRQLRGRRQRGENGRARQGDQGREALSDAAVRAGDSDQPDRHLPLHCEFGIRHGRPRAAGRMARGV